MSYEAYELPAQRSYDEERADWNALVENLGHKDGRVRRRARFAVEEMGRNVVPELCKVLREGNHYARWEAARALKDLSDPRAAPALVEALDDDFGICWLAAEGLIGLGEAALSPLLRPSSTAGAGAPLPGRAPRAHRHKGFSERLSQPIAAVLDALNDIEPSLEVPIAAWQALQQLDAESHAVTAGGAVSQGT